MMFGVDYESGLNDEQRAAVFAPDGPVLVIAAAGTGKTRTLTYRVAHLVERGVDPGRILLLTFTNRAAREMLERANGLVGEGVGGLWGGTFHHMANRMLRRHAEKLGYKQDYTIIDQDDAKSVMKAATNELGLAGKHFPKPDVLVSVFSFAANTERAVEDVALERFEDHPISVDDVLKVFTLYRKRKLGLNAMDFDDLLVNGLKLFREHPDVLSQYQDRFEHILVDEYQDTNKIQAEWVDRLAQRRKNLLVVGDDFQSIYSWRGANFRNIMTFPERYPETKVFKLETNYRSVPGILDVANACIAGNPEQFQKSLRPVRSERERPVLAVMRAGEEQAAYVADRMKMMRRAGYDYSEMAVLYRAHYHALELQLELSRQRIPFVITSGVRFFEQAHIKDVLSLLRLLSNPEDELAFLRLMGMLPKVGEKTAARIWKTLDGRCDLQAPDTLRLLAEKLPAAARDDWKSIVPVALEYKADSLDEDPGEVVYRFFHSFYDQYAIETFDNYERRKEDINALVEHTTRYETVEDFLSEVALLTNLDAESDEPDGGGDAVKLSTVHQAKGLEWKIVFVLWVVESMFPSGRSINESGGEGEERRLFYVATTRAKDRLFLCMPQVRRSRDGSVMYCSPSRFITEIPPDLLENDRVTFI